MNIKCYRCTSNTAVASNNILYVVVYRINDALFSPVQMFTFHCRVLLLTPSANICLSENLLLLYFVRKLCHTVLIARCALSISFASNDDKRKKPMKSLTVDAVVNFELSQE